MLMSRIDPKFLQGSGNAIIDSQISFEVVEG
jgi:hypothetical protein